MSAMRDDVPDVTYVNDSDGQWWRNERGKLTKIEGEPPVYRPGTQNDESTSEAGDDE